MTIDDIGLSRRRILIVEDDYFVASELASSFRSLGAEVVGPVATVETAIELVDSNDAIDLAVLDINLCGRLVYPLADILRNRGVSFLFATGYDALAIPSGYERVPHLTKPADPITVAVALGKLQRGRPDSPAQAAPQFRFRVRSHATSWEWELRMPEGEVLASGTAGSSTVARADVLRAARSRKKH